MPVLVDSRYALTRYRGLTACAPNESEVEQALGVRIDDNLRVLERAGRRILARTRMQAVIVTRGSRGMAVFEPGRKTVHIPIFGSDQIADVTGAGDTVMATLTLALAAGASIGGRGSAGQRRRRPGRDEARHRHGERRRAGAARSGARERMGEVLTRAELIDRVRQDRERGLSVAFANGAFDLLHVGHVRYLEGARHAGRSPRSSPSTTMSRCGNRRGRRGR